MADPVVMTGPADPAARAEPEAARPPGDEARFAELRALLVGPEQAELRDLRARAADQGLRLREVSLVLPDAIAERARDPKLARALAPPIAEALTASVRRDPRPLADALFPAIGPAIRKAIVHTLATMMDGFTRTVEQSLSWRALRWRWMAFRTGRPFAEIVLLETLQYRVEQVLLIHRESGLLLQHVSAEGAVSQDADQVSAMLTAIRDFAHDSFRVRSDEGLDALRVGELQVIVEQGPLAVLAAVVRGTAPPELRGLCQDAIETVHLQCGAEFAEFRGDASPFERTRPSLEACLVTAVRRPASPAISRLWIAGALVLVLLALAWVGLRWRDSHRWQGYVARLSTEPGLVVLTEGRQGGRFFVSGLRDPLAADPVALIAGTGVDPAAVDARWERFDAVHPAFVEVRAGAALRPPAGVTLTYDSGTLVARGDAPTWWVLESERIAPALAGVERFAYEGTPPDRRIAEALATNMLRFPRGSSRLVASAADVAPVATLLRDLNDLARSRRVRARVDVVGHTDSDGPETANRSLSEARANAVLERLDAARFEAIDFHIVAAASTSPVTIGTTEADKAANRRVSFAVSWPRSTMDADGTAPAQSWERQP